MRELVSYLSHQSSHFRAAIWQAITTKQAITNVTAPWWGTERTPAHCPAG